MKSTVAERKVAVVLFILVLITFSLAQRDSKRLERLYTLVQNKKANVATVKTKTPDTLQAK